jgi:hypothetical protein
MMGEKGRTNEGSHGAVKENNMKMDEKGEVPFKELQEIIRLAGYKMKSAVITEEQLLASIEESVRSLVAMGWRIATSEVSERRCFASDGEALRSLKLDLRKGPLTSNG